jgi:hypothetical protein
MFSFYVYLPDKTPEMRVAKIGVFVLELILARNLNSKPSFAIAYRILGRGNMAPNKLERKSTANYNLMKI